MRWFRSRVCGRVVFCVFSLVPLLAPSGYAGSTTVLYEQPLAISATRGLGIYSYLGGQEGADQFVLSADATITGIEWYGYGHIINGFSIALFEDSEDLPGTEIVRQTVYPTSQDTGLTTYYGIDPFSNQEIHSIVYKYTSEWSASTHIAAGATIWLSITSYEWGGWRWSGSPTGVESTDAWRFQYGPWHVHDNQQLAYTLKGTSDSTVPVPGAIVLGSVGAGLVGWLHRRRGL